MDKPIVVITGPTGSGKTALSLEMAKKFGGEIICADSMTVYKYFDIGTDKIICKTSNVKCKMSGPKESDSAQYSILNTQYSINGVPHHLIDILEPGAEFNAAIFQKMAKEKIKEIHDRGNIPFIVGGTLLYIDSLVYEYEMSDAKPDMELREELEDKTIEELQDIIKLKNIFIADTELKNKRRLIRAIEIQKKGATLPSKKTLQENVLYLTIEKNREDLYENIEKRVENMMKQGLLDEVISLATKYPATKPLEGPGYKELVSYLSRETSLDRAIEKTKQSHRNYAKRQMTWLKKNPDVIWIKNSKEVENIIKSFLDKV